MMCTNLGDDERLEEGGEDEDKGVWSWVEEEVREREKLFWRDVGTALGNAEGQRVWNQIKEGIYEEVHQMIEGGDHEEDGSTSTNLPDDDSQSSPPTPHVSEFPIDVTDCDSLCSWVREGWETDQSSPDDMDCESVLSWVSVGPGEDGSL